MNGVRVEHIGCDLFSLGGYERHVGCRRICYVCWGMGVHVGIGLAHVGGGAISSSSIAK